MIVSFVMSCPAKSPLPAIRDLPIQMCTFMPLSLLLCHCPRYTLWYSVMQKTCHYALPSTPLLSPARKLANIIAEKVNQPHRQKVGHCVSLLVASGKKCLFFCLFLDADSFSCGT